MSDLTSVPASVPADPIGQSKGSGMNSCLIIGCIIILIICCCCTLFSGFLALTVGVGLSKFTESANVFAKFCNSSDSDLRDLYNTRFTDGYRSKVTFFELKSLYENNKDVFDCGKTFKEISPDQLINGFSTDYNKDALGKETLNVKFNAKNKRIEITLVITNSDVLIDKLDINKL